MTDFDFFIAKETKEHFKQYDDNYSVLEVLEYLDPIIEYPTNKFYKFAAEGSETFIDLWEKVAPHFNKEYLEKFDRCDAMTEILKVEMANYVEDRNEVSHVIPQAEEDMLKYAIERLPIHHDETYDNLIIFDGDAKSYRENKELISEVFSGTYELKIESPEHFHNILKEIYKDNQAYKAPKSIISFSSKENIGLIFKGGNLIKFSTEKNKEMNPQRTATIFNIVRSMLDKTQAEEAIFEYTNPKTGIKITETGSEVIIDNPKNAEFKKIDELGIKSMLEKKITVNGKEQKNVNGTEKTDKKTNVR